jgi:cytochrome c biogenesis protein CcmG, thiol:disulfide interchange protein DsbE
MYKYLLSGLLLFSLNISAQIVEKNLYAKSFINQKAPDLYVTKWLTEEPKREGKFLLLDFWATWCGPCRKAIPELNKFYKEFKNDLVVIGISNEKEEVIKRMQVPQIEYYSAIDSTEQMEKILEIRGIPHVLIIDPEGYVRWQGYPLYPGFELTSDIIKEIIDNYKKKHP